LSLKLSGCILEINPIENPLEILQNGVHHRNHIDRSDSIFPAGKTAAPDIFEQRLKLNTVESVVADFDRTFIG